MNKEFLVYDLETFGIDLTTTISQFAARRYDCELNPIDDGVILYCKLPLDCVPSIGACVLTGITPSLVNERGEKEIEFAKKVYSILNNNANKTIILGYNNTSFDNKVVNNLFFRNFIPPYSTFLDRTLDCYTVVKAVHYLDKNKLKYIQVERDGQYRDSLKLENLTKANNLIHTKAHDALSDVEATAALFGLIKNNCNVIFNKYLHCATKTNTHDLLKYSANAFTPIMFLRKKNLIDNEYVSLGIILASKGNIFYAFDLLPPEEDFQNSLDCLSAVQNLNGDDYIENIMPFCHAIKINESPYIDYGENFYKDKTDKNEITNLVDSRIKKIKNILNVKYFSTNYSNKIKMYPQIDNKEEKEVEDTILEGAFIAKEVPQLARIASSNDAEDIKNALYTITKYDCSLRVKKLFTHLVGRNYEEILDGKILDNWNTYVKNRLLKQKDAFLNERQSILDSNLCEDKVKIIKEVTEYEQKIFNKFSLQLF